MKALRFFLIITFMLTLFVSPVQAQAADEYSFAPLITQIKAGIPLRVQARRAFEQLLPKCYY